MFTIDKDTDTMTIIRKDTASFDVSLDNYTLSEGDKVTFTVAAEKESEEPLIQIEVQEFTDGVATVRLSSENTDIEEGSYLYDIQVDTADGRVDTIVGPSKFKVLGGVTY